MNKGLYVISIVIVTLIIILAIVIINFFNKANDNSLKNSNGINVMRNHNHDMNEITEECHD